MVSLPRDEPFCIVYAPYRERESERDASLFDGIEMHIVNLLMLIADGTFYLVEYWYAIDRGKIRCERSIEEES
jgi:hypothetical protein